MPYQEKPIEKIYFSVGEIAEKFKVSPSLLRFWESEFDELRPKKNYRGARRYKAADIEVIAHIYNLVKVERYTLEGARKKLPVMLGIDAEEMKNAMRVG